MSSQFFLKKECVSIKINNILIGFSFNVLLTTSILYYLSDYDIVNYQIVITLLLCLIIFGFLIFYKKYKFHKKIVTRIISTKLLWPTIIAIVHYSLLDLSIYQFPFRDFFAGVHFYRGINELILTGGFNPFNTDSYLPVVQQILAPAIFFSNGNILTSENTSNYLFIFFSLLFIYQLLNFLINSHYKYLNIYIAWLITLNCFASPISNTVFSTYSIICFIFISFSTKTINNKMLNTVLIITIAIITYFFILYLCTQFEFHILRAQSLILILMSMLIIISYFFKSNYLSLFMQLLFLFGSLFSHRSGVALCSAVAFFILYFTFFNSTQNPYFCKTKPIWMILYFLNLILFFSFPLSILSQKVLIKPIAETMYFLFKIIFSNNDQFSGSITLEFLSSAFYEFVRYFTPFKSLILLPFFWISLKRQHLTNIFLLNSISILILPSLMAIPYAHRLLYLPLSLFFILCFSNSKNQEYRSVLIFFILSTNLFTLCLYFIPYEKINFVNNVPFLFFSSIIAIAFFYISIKKNSNTFFITALFLSLLNDSSTMKMIFIKYSFGQNVNIPISHMNANDLKCSSQIKKIMVKNQFYVFLSDPHTVANITSLTKAYPAYTFENLEKIPPVFKSNLSQLLKKVSNTDPTITKHLLLDFLKSHNRSYELMYAFKKRYKSEITKNNIRFIIYYNNHTLDWLSGTEGYSPNNFTIDKKYLNVFNDSANSYYTVNQMCYFRFI